MNETLAKLRKPFHPSAITWKPGAVKGDRALALAYADLRAYMNRLDEVCDDDWSVAYEPWGQDRIVCRLTIGGVTRSSTGESNNESERSEIGGTVAEAQAFKRACAMFGLGRYLYNLPSGWADYDPAKKQFTEKAKVKLMQMLVQHYRRATGDNVVVDTQRDEDAPDFSPLLERFQALGQELYGDQWEHVCKRNAKRVSAGKTEDANELTPEQVQMLIAGMSKLKEQKKVAA